MMDIDKKIDKALATVEGGSYRTLGRTSMQRFGERLKHWREDRGFSRSELVKAVAERGIPCSSSNLSYWESGKRMPTPDTLDALCDVLQISGAHLFGPDGDLRDSVIAMFEVITSMSPERQRAMMRLYEEQRKRREEKKQEEIQQQRDDMREMRKIFGV